MRIIKPLAHQTIEDIAIEHCGSVEAAMPIAVLNGLPLGAPIPTHVFLQVPDVFAKGVHNHFLNREKHPANTASGVVFPLTIEAFTIGIDAQIID